MNKIPFLRTLLVSVALLVSVSVYADGKDDENGFWMYKSAEVYGAHEYIRSDDGGKVKENRQYNNGVFTLKREYTYKGNLYSSTATGVAKGLSQKLEPNKEMSVSFDLTSDPDDGPRENKIWGRATVMYGSYGWNADTWERAHITYEREMDGMFVDNDNHYAVVAGSGEKSSGVLKNNVITAKDAGYRMMYIVVSCCNMDVVYKYEWVTSEDFSYIHKLNGFEHAMSFMSKITIVGALDIRPYDFERNKYIDSKTKPGKPGRQSTFLGYVEPDAHLVAIIEWAEQNGPKDFEPERQTLSIWLGNRAYNRDAGTEEVIKDLDEILKDVDLNAVHNYDDPKYEAEMAKINNNPKAQKYKDYDPIQHYTMVSNATESYKQKPVQLFFDAKDYKKFNPKATEKEIEIRASAVVQEGATLIEDEFYIKLIIAEPEELAKLKAELRQEGGGDDEGSGGIPVGAIAIGAAGGLIGWAAVKRIRKGKQKKKTVMDKVLRMKKRQGETEDEFKVRQMLTDLKLRKVKNAVRLRRGEEYKSWRWRQDQFEEITKRQEEQHQEYVREKTLDKNVETPEEARKIMQDEMDNNLLPDQERTQRSADNWDIAYKTTYVARHGSEIVLKGFNAVGKATNNTALEKVTNGGLILIAGAEEIGNCINEGSGFVVTVVRTGTAAGVEYGKSKLDFGGKKWEHVKNIAANMGYDTLKDEVADITKGEFTVKKLFINIGKNGIQNATSELTSLYNGKSKWKNLSIQTGDKVKSEWINSFFED